MDDRIELLFSEPRSLERALADSCEKYERNPHSVLARKIEVLRHEAEQRKYRLNLDC
jgi:hypothetical protein